MRKTFSYTSENRCFPDDFPSSLVAFPDQAVYVDTAERPPGFMRDFFYGKRLFQAAPAARLIR